MNFNLDKSIAILERTPRVYYELFHELAYDWATINEGENTWSGFDIIGHLIYGEKTDWIPRARIILGESENKTFEPFDRFAQKKLSAGKTIEDLLIEFAELRSNNLNVLRSWHLTEVELNMEGIHPDLGVVTLRELLSTWTIHDIGHLHQVSRVIVKHYSMDVGPWTEYSGILRKK